MAAIRRIQSHWKWVVAILCLTRAAQAAQVNPQFEPANQNATIAGTVQNEAGAMQNARVSLFLLVTTDGWTRLERRCFVQTDSNGSYRCAGLAPGKYIVLASAGPESEKPGPESEKQNKAKDPQSPYAFFPSTTDLEGAAEIAARAGQLQTADIFVGSADLYTVSCRIASRPHNVSASLLARTDGMLLADTGIRGRYDEIQGQVRFERVPRGSFEVLARWRTGREVHYSQANVTVQSANLEDLSLEEQQPVSLEGHITVDVGSVDSGSSVKLLNVVLERAFETNMGDGPIGVSTRVTGNGDFFFSPPLLPGSYFLKVVGDPGVFVESSTMSGLSRDGPLLSIKNGSANLIQIEVGTPVGSIGGVVGNLPELNPKAVVLVESEESGQTFTTTTDQSGKFMVSGLGPGRYRVYTWRDFSDVAYRDPRALHQYEEATEVSLQSDAMNQIVNIDLNQNR